MINQTRQQKRQQKRNQKSFDADYELQKKEKSPTIKKADRTRHQENFNNEFELQLSTGHPVPELQKINVKQFKNDVELTEKIESYNEKIDEISELKNTIEQAKIEAQNAGDGDELLWAKTKKSAAEIDLMFAQQNCAEFLLTFHKELKKHIENINGKNSDNVTKKRAEIKQEINNINGIRSGGNFLIDELIQRFGPRAQKVSFDNKNELKHNAETVITHCKNQLLLMD